MHAGELGFQAERLAQDYYPPALAADFFEAGAKARTIDERLFPRR